MDKQRIFWGIIALLGICSPALGMLIGLVRYKKHGEEIRKRVDEDYKRAQERGGIHSLYYKDRGKRVFKLTFGTPLAVTFLIGLGLLCLAFNNL